MIHLIDQALAAAQPPTTKAQVRGTGCCATPNCVIYESNAGFCVTMKAWLLCSPLLGRRCALDSEGMKAVLGAGDRGTGQIELWL